MRAPDAAQRAALRGVVRCRSGVHFALRVALGPGSAEQREERCTASGTREDGTASIKYIVAAL
jgi:hypothetical protein